METSLRLSALLREMPESPYARELALCEGALRFSTDVEAEYIAGHLQRVRLRARLWCLLSLAFSTAFSAGQLRDSGPYAVDSLLHLYVLVPIWAVLCAIAWSAAYVRFYLPAARIGMSVSSLLIGWFIAESVADGREEELVLATVVMMGSFLFSGLLIRAAAFAGAALVVAFAFGTLAFDVPLEHASRCTLFLATAGAAAALVWRDSERWLRTSFLKTALISDLVERDALTGLKNRRAFDEHLRRVWQQAQRDQRSLAIALVDVDHFKRYNDSYGHQAGDETLRRVGRTLRDAARRPLDLAARYGGEEFAMIFYDLTAERVASVAEQLRRRVEELHTGSAALRARVTISAGVVVIEPSIGRTTMGALQLADEALYEAKSRGRNRVVLRQREDTTVGTSQFVGTQTG